MNLDTDHALQSNQNIIEDDHDGHLKQHKTTVSTKPFLEPDRIKVILKVRLRRDLRISVPETPTLDDKLNNQVKIRVLKHQSDVELTIPPSNCINIVYVDESAKKVIQNPASYEGKATAYILMQNVTKKSNQVARFEMTKEQLITYLLFYCPTATVPAFFIECKNDLQEYFIDYFFNYVVPSTKKDIRGLFESEERLSKMIDNVWAEFSASLRPSQSTDSAKLGSTDNPANPKPVDKLASESSGLTDNHNATRTDSPPSVLVDTRNATRTTTSSLSGLTDTSPSDLKMAAVSKSTDLAEDTYNATRTCTSPSATDASTLADSPNSEVERLCREDQVYLPSVHGFVLEGIVRNEELVSKRTIIDELTNPTFPDVSKRTIIDELTNPTFPDRKEIMKILAKDQNHRGIACDATASLDRMLCFILGPHSEQSKLADKIEEFGRVVRDASPIKDNMERIRVWRNALIHPKQLFPDFEALDTKKDTFLSLCETSFTFLSTLWKKDKEIEALRSDNESLQEEIREFRTRRSSPRNRNQLQHYQPSPRQHQQPSPGHPARLSSPRGSFGSSGQLPYHQPSPRHPRGRDFRETPTRNKSSSNNYYGYYGPSREDESTPTGRSSYSRSSGGPPSGKRRRSTGGQRNNNSDKKQRFK